MAFFLAPIFGRFVGRTLARALGNQTGKGTRTTKGGSPRHVHVTATFKGPLFSDSRRQSVYAAMTKSMQVSVLLGESTIKRGYTKSPSLNVVGGRRTGHLSRGVRGKVFSPFHAEISPGKFVYGSDVPYASIVEQGRPASNKVVRAKRGRALRFKPRGSSEFIFRRSVRPFKRKLIGNPMFEKTASSQSFNRAITKIFSDNIKAALT